MYPFDEDKDRRKRRSPFDLFDDKEFERIFREMEKMMQRAFKDLPFDDIKPGKSFVHGFNIHVGPDGKPKLHEFGNRSLRRPNGERSISEEREPLTDIIEGDEDVAITVEIPGVEKEDIDLKSTENSLEIKVDTPQRKYHRTIDLPCNVKPKSTKATYKNGILDIVIKRKEKKSDTDGYKVNIE